MEIDNQGLGKICTFNKTNFSKVIFIIPLSGKTLIVIFDH